MIDIVQNGFASCFGPNIAEGVVARPVVEMFNRFRERIITKLKYKDFAR